MGSNRGVSFNTKPLPAKAGRLLFRLKVDLRLKRLKGSPLKAGSRRRWGRYFESLATVVLPLL